MRTQLVMEVEQVGGEASLMVLEFLQVAQSPALVYEAQSVTAVAVAQVPSACLRYFSATERSQSLQTAVLAAAPVATYE